MDEWVLFKKCVRCMQWLCCVAAGRLPPGGKRAPIRRGVWVCGSVSPHAPCLSHARTHTQVNPQLARRGVRLVAIGIGTPGLY
jgi:hypothetical protein